MLWLCSAQFAALAIAAAGRKQLRGCARLPPSLPPLACNAVVLLCSGRTRPPHSAMPGPSTAKQASGPTRREIAQSRLAPAARQRPRPSPPSARAVRTCPCRRGSPRGRLSGQKLSCGSWDSPSGGDASQKLVWPSAQLRHSWPSPPPAAAQSCGPAKAEF